ncbi:MAG: 30S ribosomal protein S7 [Chloroflexi bacterium RBG_13_68_17]|jgi:small subunit ribosomal protein S7|nr:MAG: 30S ribosomal protein S7 [Chloroflexi bacterium RBG_13_68_17]
MRRTKPEKRDIPGDARYNNVIVQGFINRLMRRGKKSTASSVVYGAFDLIEARAKREPVDIFEQAMRNVSPTLEVKPRRVGGATYQVPVEVAPERRTSLAMRWILAAARARAGKSMAEKLAGELMDAANNGGAAIKRKEETHKMAEANRAFAHYRW